MEETQIPRPDWGGMLRRLILAWLAAALAGYSLLSPARKALADPQSAAAVSLPLMGAVFLCVLAGLMLLGRRYRTAPGERWLLFGLVLALLGQSCFYIQAPEYRWAAAGLAVLCLVYALRGRSSAPPLPLPEGKQSRLFLTAAGVAALASFVFLALWGLARVGSFGASTFDFGIFAQMLHKMSVTGQPLTTLERDGLLSHFAVHLSPIWYLLLPFWLLWPRPELLPVLQAAVLVSAVVPLWLLAKQLGFSPWARCLSCVLLLVHPVFSGGIAYDIHENCFLTPLLLWLFWAAEGKRSRWTAAFALLVLCVKEDAPVYGAVFGLYLLLRGLLDREAWDRKAGAWLLTGSLVWFLGATAILRIWGEGVMDYRYGALMAPGSGSLLSVVGTVLTAPLRALAVCAEPEKAAYLAGTLLPLLCLPLLTRKQERYLLLIPYVLYHLLTSYAYQYDLLFQYGYGSLAFLLYLTLLNLRDLLPRLKKCAMLRPLPLLAAIGLCASVLWTQVVPKARLYLDRYQDYRGEWEEIRADLELVPRDAVVTASTYLTQGLCDCRELYDVYYTTDEHLYASDYVVLYPLFRSDCRRWDTAPDAGDGTEVLRSLLEERGYRILIDRDPWIVIYEKVP